MIIQKGARFNRGGYPWRAGRRLAEKLNATAIQNVNQPWGGPGRAGGRLAELAKA